MASVMVAPAAGNSGVHGNLAATPLAGNHLLFCHLSHEGSSALSLWQWISPVLIPSFEERRYFSRSILFQKMNVLPVYMCAWRPEASRCWILWDWGELNIDLLQEQKGS